MDSGVTYNMKTILCVIGTRPEAIKMAPVVKRLRKEAWARVRVVATAQHREMLDQIFSVFQIVPDVDLDLMQPNQTLADLTARMLMTLTRLLESERPDAVLAQGDTTTVMTTALACYYQKIAFGHVEAGLRTGNSYNPFPEEVNRVIAGRLASWHFAPTEGARSNLLREGLNDKQITVTGNTVIDALLDVANRDNPMPLDFPADKRLILVTAHRRENFGKPLENIFCAIRALAEKNNDIQVIYPVHPNPNVMKLAHKMLGNNPRILLLPPLDYVLFIELMKRAYLVLTDSGGVQEEAPALGKPALVLRDETERPEAVEAGVVRLIGTETGRIINEVQRLLDDKDAYLQMARGVSPYGDGRAAERIAQILRDSLAPENVNY